MATEEHDQHRDFRSGTYNGFNMEWYDKLRATKPNWKKESRNTESIRTAVFLSTSMPGRL